MKYEAEKVGTRNRSDLLNCVEHGELYRVVSAIPVLSKYIVVRYRREGDELRECPNERKTIKRFNVSGIKIKVGDYLFHNKGGEWAHWEVPD